MFLEAKVTEIYYIVDDFYKKFANGQLLFFELHIELTLLKKKKTLLLAYPTLAVYLCSEIHFNS